MNPIYGSLLVNKDVSNMVAEAKSKNVIDIENLFLLLLTARTDAASVFFNLPLDIIGEILNNSAPIEERVILKEWFKPTNLINKVTKFSFSAFKTLRQPLNVIQTETPKEVPDFLKEALLKNRNFFESVESSDSEGW